MDEQFIFKTERLLVRKLILGDLQAFHRMESNPNVLQFATGEVKSLEENTIELKDLIGKYEQAENDFWIYAIVRRSDDEFVGTCALVKDDEDDEIGYRFLEEYWGNGYGTEICIELVKYCKHIGMKKLIGYVVDKNNASAKILERCNFKVVKKFMNDEIQLEETKYELIL